MPIVIGTVTGSLIYLSFPNPTLQGFAICAVVCVFAALFGQWLALR